MGAQLQRAWHAFATAGAKDRLILLPEGRVAAVP